MLKAKKNKSKPKKSLEPPKPGLNLSLTRGETAAWAGLFLFICIWVFVLGVLAGRSTAPALFDINSLQKKLAGLKQEGIKKELAAINSNAEQIKPALDFQEALKDNKNHQKQEEKIKVAIKKDAVKKKPPEEKTAPKEKVDLFSKKNKNNYTIQVASVQDPVNAEKLVRELRQMGFPAYKIAAEIEGKGVWHRVRVGSFSSKDEAAGTLDKLKTNRKNGYVVSR